MNPTTNIAIRAAKQAGAIIMRYFNRLEKITIVEKNLNDYVSEVDRSAELAIIDTIRRSYPNHAILAEETGSHGHNEHVWIIDPLDGTTNYLHGFPQFAVSIALRRRDKLETSVIYAPLTNELYTASRGGGAMLNDRRLRVSGQTGLPGALVGTGIPFRDQRFVDAYLAMLKAMMADTAGIRRPGSAALDMAFVAAGRVDGFWELGLSAWDFAAGALLVQEAGGIVTDIRGGDQYFTSGNLIAGSPKVQAEMVRRLAEYVPDNMAC